MSRYMRGMTAALLWLGISLAAHAQTTVEYIHTDALGTPIAVTDANKVVIETTEYEPYGAQVAGPVKDGPGYTGHVQDVATGLTYMQQRYYDPTVGRFLSVDPVTAYSNPVGMFNRYRYANNSPYRFTDPDGRQAAERFVEQHRRDIEAGNGKIYEPLEKPAVAVTTAMLPGGPIVRAVVGRLLKPAKQDKPSAKERADEIHGKLDTRAQSSRTTAVTETSEGVRVVSSSERRLTPAQRADLKTGEVEGVGAGHAEATGVRAAKEMGLTPTGTAASRPICEACASGLRSEGVQPLSPLKKPN